MAESTKQVRRFKIVSSEFTKLEKIGDSAEGSVVAITEDAVGTGNKTRPVFVLRHDDGRLLKVPVSESCRAELATIGVGEYVKISFRGEEKTSRGLNPVKLYKFEVAE